MSKMQGLEEVLKKSSGKSVPPVTGPKAPASIPEPAPAVQTKTKPTSTKTQYCGAWLHPDFGISLRMVQLRRQKDAEGRKVYLDDLMAEALNDLFVKYDVPTVQHD